jgi:ATP-binding cassette subfamily B protein
MTNKKFSSLYEVYKLSVEIAGEYNVGFKRSLLLFFISFVTLGLAFAMFFPLLKAIFSPQANINEIIYWFSFMAFFSAISIITKWFGHNFDYSGYIVEITNDLRVKLGKKLRSMPLHTLSKYKTGELNSILSSNVDESILHMGVVSALFMQITVVPIVIVLFTFFIDYKLALIMLAILPFAIPLYIIKRKVSIEEKKDFNDANSNLESQLIEYIQGLPVLRSVNQVGKNAKQLDLAVKKVRTIQEEGAGKSTLPLLIMGSLVEIVLLVLVFLGGMWVEEGSLTLITLAALLVVVSRLTEPLTLFLGVIPVFDTMDSAFNRIKTVLDIKSLKTFEPKQKAKSFDIEFKNVFYSYDKDDNYSLNDVSFNIKQNSLTAIVGHSGCGKTTITKMLMRYDDVSKGSVKIGGVNIKNMTQKDLMKDISVVFQDVYLFDDTVLNNIKMAKPKATKDEIIKACKLANCHDFIQNLPDSYDTNIGDLGGNLSGGEKQRISIARAILKDAPIVILDEPTASLDTKSELAVQKAIDSLVKNRTVIVIAHRLSTITHADNILVMSEGEIIQQGKHEQILVLSEIYKSMWEAQTRTKNWNT